MLLANKPFFFVVFVFFLIIEEGSGLVFNAPFLARREAKPCGNKRQGLGASSTNCEVQRLLREVSTESPCLRLADRDGATQWKDIRRCDSVIRETTAHEPTGPNKARDQWGSSRLQRRTRKTIGKKKKEQAKGPKEAPKDADPTQLQGMLDYLQSLGGKFEDLGYQKTEEVDMNVGYGEEEEQDEDFDSPYLEKEEETDLIKAAQKRAREHLIPIQRQRPDQVHPDPNLRVYQSGSLLDHPLSAILRALHIPDDIFSSNPPRFTGVSLGRSAQELSLEARISPSQKHLVVRYSEDVWRIEGQGESSSLTLPPLLYLCWRTVALGNMRGRTYPANQTPRSPNVPLEYITFWDIRNGKTLVVLNRVSELPGYGLKHYQDPDGRKNRFAYFFNVALLERYHEGSAEAEALASLLGTTEILSVIKILQDFPNGLYQAKIQSIFFVLEYPKTAVMFVQLVLQAPGNSVLSSSTLGVSTELDFLVDEQPASNRNLIITSQGLKLEHHPLGVQEAHPGPSYFAGSAEYVLASGMQPKVNFQYSRLEKHLVLDRLQHFSYGDESSSIRTLANILNSIWIRQTGAVQLNHITLLGLTGFTGGYIKKKTQSPNGYRALKFDNPEEIYPILRDLVQIKSRDILVLQALLEEGAAVFGEYQVTVLMIGVHDKHGACLVMSIAHDPGRPINTDGESLFGAAEDPPMLALRRGTYSKAQTEFMTLTYLEDQPIYANELRSMSIDRRQQLLKDDASLVKNVELISSPADISECHSMGTDELPSFLSDIIAWSFERQDGTKFDDGQLRWRAKMASELPQDDFKLTSAASPFCRFSLSVPDSSIPNEKLNPQDLALPGLETIEIKDFWLAVNREFGNILLSTKFPESEGETGASSVVMRFGDAIWALWIRHQEATFKSDMRSWTRFKRGLFGLRHITIPQPSAQTTKVLQGLYKRYDLNKEETQLFVNTEYGVEIPTEHQTPKESLKRRVLLTLNGLAEVYAIDDLCRRIFLRPYPVLNPKRRVGALWIKWDRDLPQLIISLDDFVFENKDADGKNFKTAIAIRGRPDLKEVTEVGCGVTWSSRSSYAFEISDFINVHGQGVPEYDVQENPKLSGCPKEIQDFVGSLPWQAENLTPGKINDLRRLAVETSANAQVGDSNGLWYSRYTYKHRYSTSEYTFSVLEGWPYHLLVEVAKDGQIGLPQQTLVVRAARLSRAYYDVFTRAIEKSWRPGGSETVWVSILAGQLSFDTLWTIRKIWSVIASRNPDLGILDVSFVLGKNPTIEQKEKFQIGKTLLGLLEIAALGRMLSDHAIAMQNLRITKIVINRDSGDGGLSYNSFQILLLLEPAVYV